MKPCSFHPHGKTWQVAIVPSDYDVGAQCDDTSKCEILMERISSNVKMENLCKQSVMHVQDKEPAEDTGQTSILVQ